MSENAKSRRRYDAPKRREQAAHTRVKIIEAASRVFLELGYTRATIPRIAAEAGVAVETVYRSASGKAGLLAAAVQAALAGGAQRADVPVEQRPGIKRVIEEADPRRQLELYAATQPGVWARVGPLLRVLEQAAMTDDALVELRRRHTEQRREGLRRFAALLAERGALRSGLTTDRAGDILFTVCAQANYDALVGTLGWTTEEYQGWVADTLAHALLG
jgi:AcrR family transcriptional regulator